MKKSLFLLVSVIMLFLLTSCSGESEAINLKYGTYTLEQSESKIVLSENDTIKISNYDFTELEKSSYEDFLIS